MQEESDNVLSTGTKVKVNHTVVKTWQEFIDRAMDLLVENPTISKFVIKFIPKTRKFVLKVTDGNRIVIKKCPT